MNHPSYISKKQQLHNRLGEIIDAIINSTLCDNISDLKSDFELIKRELSNDVFRITVVGEFSSGKSTFLNAMIGKEILLSTSRETTAAITYIHNVSIENELCNRVVVTLRDGQEVEFDISDKEKMKEFSTCNSKEHNVAFDVDHVDVYVHFENTDENIMLIDTPGLNGMEDGHRDLTLKEIGTSNASICLFGPKGLAQTDVDFLKILFRHQSCFFFVQNCIDQFKKEENETPEGKVEELRGRLKQVLYDNQKDPEFVFGISSLKALVGRDHGQRKLYNDDERDVNENDRKEFIEASGILQLEKTLFDFINSDKRVQTFYGSIVQQSLDLLNNVKNKREQYKNILEIRQNSKSLTAYRDKLITFKAKAEEEMAEYSKQIEFKVKSRLSDVENPILDILNEDLDKHLNKMKSIVNSKTEIDELKSFSQNFGKGIVNFQIEEQNKIYQKTDEKVIDKVNELCDEMIKRLPELNVIASPNTFSIKIETENNTSMNFQISLNKEKDKIEDKIHKLEKESKELRTELAEAKENEKDLQKIENKTNKIYRDKQNKLKNLGVRPSSVTKYRTETRQKGGLLGAIASIFGCGTYKEKVPYTDDSRGQRWDEERKNIIKKFDKELKDLSSQRNLLEEMSRNPINIQSEINRTEQKINQQRQLLEDKKEEIKQRERYQKAKYLENLKNSFINQIDDILSPKSGKIHNAIKQQLQRILDRRVLDAEEYLRKEFDRKRNAFLQDINGLINKENNSIDSSDSVKSFNLVKSQVEFINNNINKIEKLAHEYGICN